MKGDVLDLVILHSYFFIIENFKGVLYIKYEAIK